MITLRELASTHARADVMDIMVWNNDTGDYDDVLGYEDFKDLQKVVDNAIKDSKESIAQYLDYGVVDVEVSMYDSHKTYLRIEIGRGN